MLHPDVASQVETLALAVARPTIISDADDVLFHFIDDLERYLRLRQLYFDWRSYTLVDTIRHAADDTALAREDALNVLVDFFALRTEALRPVDGAAPALARISRRAQIVVLSNLPIAHAGARRRALAAAGMDYPLVANVGGKGAAVAAIAQRVQAPVFFIDDLPRHHQSVRESAAAVQRLHYVADKRLSAIIGPPTDCHHVAESWPDIERIIGHCLDAGGY